MCNGLGATIREDCSLTLQLDDLTDEERVAYEKDDHEAEANTGWPTHYVNEVVDCHDDFDRRGDYAWELPESLGYLIGISTDQVDNFRVGGLVVWGGLFWLFGFIASKAFKDL
ncbi:hypothetical protein HG530_003766 [Fusarium avenaceum]|nr:hypothetical protein HG530_003766 [Fusarium avenaceum]